MYLQIPHPQTLFAAAAALLMLAPAAALADGDAAAGEKDFGKCKACHSIVDGDTIIQKGGKTGPDLFQVVGRPAAAVEGFAYGPGIRAAAEKGLVWDVEALEAYVRDPTAFLSEFVGAKAVSKMTFKLKKSENVIAYLASFGEYPAE